MSDSPVAVATWNEREVSFMQELISKHAALEACKRVFDEVKVPKEVEDNLLEREVACGVKVGAENAMLAVMGVPSPWVSVKDRLPEKGSICLVCGKNGGMRVARANYHEPLDLWTIVGTGKPFKVTHWMELPAPPTD